MTNYYLDAGDLARIAEDEAREDADERESAVGMANPPHYEWNDGTCVSCGATWPCTGWPAGLEPGPRQSFQDFTLSVAAEYERLRRAGLEADS